MNKRAFVFVFLAATACAQVPDAPSHSLTTTDKVLLGGLVALNGADAWLTNQNMRSGGREDNPLARVFVSRGSGMTAAYFAGATVLDVWLVRKLNRHHPRIARAYLLSTIGLEGFCVISSWAHSTSPVIAKPNLPVHHGPIVWNNHGN